MLCRVKITLPMTQNCVTYGQAWSWRKYIGIVLAIKSQYFRQRPCCYTGYTQRKRSRIFFPYEHQSPGTLHRGGHHAAGASFYAAIIRITLRSIKSDLLKSLGLGLIITLLRVGRPRSWQKADRNSLGWTRSGPRQRAERLIPRCPVFTAG